MTWPTLLIADGEADFTSVSAGLDVAGTVVVDGAEVIGLVSPGGVPCVVAESLTLPVSRSACVTVYVAVQVSEAPKASVDCGQVGPEASVPAGAVCVSVTATLCTGTLPVLVTR